MLSCDLIRDVKMGINIHMTCGNVSCLSLVGRCADTHYINLSQTKTLGCYKPVLERSSHSIIFT